MHAKINPFNVLLLTVRVYRLIYPADCNLWGPIAPNCKTHRDLSRVRYFDLLFEFLRNTVLMPVKNTMFTCYVLKNFYFDNKYIFLDAFFLRLNSAQNFSNTLKNRVSKGSRFLAIGDFLSVRGHLAPRLHTDR